MSNSNRPVSRRLILEIVSAIISAIDHDHLDIAMTLLDCLETRLLSDELTINGRVFDSGVQSSFRH